MHTVSHKTFTKQLYIIHDVRKFSFPSKLQGDNINWWYNEGRALWLGLVAFWAMRVYFFAFWHVRMQQKVGSLQSGKIPSVDTKSAASLILNIKPSEL